MAKDAVYIVVTFILVIIAGFLVFERFSVEEMEVEDVQVEEVDTREAVTGSFEAEIDLVQSVLGWQAERTILTTHVNTGTLNLSSGGLVFKDGQILSGEFAIDMKSLALTSVHGGDPAISGGNTLLRHLSSGDFFDIEEYPESTFVIKKVAKSHGDFTYKVTGDLTVKDVTNEIEFPAKVYADDGKIFITGTASVDRTKWDITFASLNFFGDIGDMVINDSFEVEILLFASVVEEVVEDGVN